MDKYKVVYFSGEMADFLKNENHALQDSIGIKVDQ